MTFKPLVLVLLAKFCSPFTLWVPTRPSSATPNGLCPSQKYLNDISENFDFFGPSESYLCAIGSLVECPPQEAETTDVECSELALFKKPRRGMAEFLEDVGGLLDELDHYAVLGISKTATSKQVKAAFRQKVLQWKCHPDLREDEDGMRIWDSLRGAHEVLTDPERREAYDRRLQTKAIVERVIVVAEKAVAYVISDIMPAAQGIALHAHELWKAAQLAAKDFDWQGLAPVEKLALPDHKELWRTAQKKAQGWNLFHFMTGSLKTPALPTATKGKDPD